MKKKHIGSTLSSLFEELGESEEVELLAQKNVLAERATVRAQLAENRAEQLPKDRQRPTCS